MRLVNPAAAAESADSAEQPPNSVASSAKLHVMLVSSYMFYRERGGREGMYAVRKKIQLKKSKTTGY